MTDSDLRGLILKHLYANRRTPHFRIEGTDLQPVIDDDELVRICEQLEQHRMVKNVIDLAPVPCSS